MSKKVVFSNEHEYSSEKVIVKERSLSIDIISKKYFIEGIKKVEITTQTNLDDKQMLSISPPKESFLNLWW
jgi:hypothetical protein